MPELDPEIQQHIIDSQEKRERLAASSERLKKAPIFEKGEGWKRADADIQKVQEDLAENFGVEKPELIGPTDEPITTEKSTQSAEETIALLRDARERLSKIANSNKDEK